jgi:NADH-quinone oxidoreductase subunit L
MFDNVWLIPLFPLIGFLINGLFGKKIKNEAVIGGIGTLMIFLSFLVSCGILMQMIGLPPEQRVFEKVLFPWIHSGNFKADMAFLEKFSDTRDREAYIRSVTINLMSTPDYQLM